MDNFLKISGLLAWALLTIAVVLRLYYGKNWLLKIGIQSFVGTGLMGATKKLVKEYRQKDTKIQDETIGAFGTHLIWRLTRIGLFAILLALVPFILLFQQNQLLETQNEKIDSQNDRINIQNNLIEADRRSSLVFLMSNVLDKVDEEIREKKKRKGLDKLDVIPDSIRFRLSDPLIGRIVALSRAFKPYQQLINDSLQSKPMSPERGQLFIALMESQLDSFTQSTIVADGDFSNAIMTKTNFRREVLNYANLSKANLSEAILRGAKLCGADLRGAGLFLTDFRRADLREADLHGVKLFATDFRGADLRGAKFQGASFRKVKFHGADLSRAVLLHVKILSKYQLLSAKSLYQVRSLDPNIKAELIKEKPCLFTKDGCPENK